MSTVLKKDYSFSKPTSFDLIAFSLQKNSHPFLIIFLMSISSQCENGEQFYFQEEDKEFIFNTPSKKSTQTSASESHIHFSETKMAMNDKEVNGLLFSPQVKREEDKESQEVIALACWKRGDFYLEEGKLDLAIKQYKQCIEASPFLTKMEQFVGLGCIEDRIGYHYESEASWIAKMAGITSQAISPHDSLSVCLSKSKDYEEEKEWYERMIKSTNDYRLIYGLANLEYNFKKFTQAEALYKRCLCYKLNLDQIYQKIANIYCFKLNKDDEATVWAEKCLEINPNNIYACLIKSLCIKSVDERIERLKDILDIVSDYARPFNGLGNAYYNNGNYDDAIAMYKKSIEINSKYEHPYYGLGSIYNQISNFEESIIWYKRCIEVNPYYDYPLYGLGIAYNNKNDMKNAIYWLERCIEVNPKYDCPYYALGNIYRTNKKFDLALKFYKKSLECKKIDPLCFVNIALSYISLRDYSNAYDYMIKAKDNLNEVEGLSKGNIEYVKEQVNKYLGDDKGLEKNQKGMLSFKQVLEMSSNMSKFQFEFRRILAEDRE